MTIFSHWVVILCSHPYPRPLQTPSSEFIHSAFSLKLLRSQSWRGASNSELSGQGLQPLASQSSPTRAPVLCRSPERLWLLDHSNQGRSSTTLQPVKRFSGNLVHPGFGGDSRKLSAPQATDYLSSNRWSAISVHRFAQAIPPDRRGTLDSA